MKKTQKGNVAVIAVIIMIVAITAGVVGYLFAKKVQTPTEKAVATQPSAQTQQVQQPTQPADETANWQTYSNAKYGFEFKYPRIWELKDYENLNIVTLSSAQRDETIMGDAPLDNVGFYYYSSLQELTKQAANLDEFITTGKEVVFSDMKKIDFVGTNAWAGTEASISGSYVIYIEKNSHIYKIEFGTIGSEYELSFIDKNILSTFRFTDATSVSEDEKIDVVQGLLTPEQKNKNPKITIMQAGDNFIKANLFFNPGGYYILVAKVNGKWAKVSEGNGIPKCEDVAKYGLSKNVTGCVE